MGNVVSAVGFKHVRKSQEFVFGIESVHIDVGCELGLPLMMSGEL
jgi:hypothetical protein